MLLVFFFVVFFFFFFGGGYIYCCVLFVCCFVFCSFICLFSVFWEGCFVFCFVLFCFLVLLCFFCLFVCFLFVFCCCCCCCCCCFLGGAVGRVLLTAIVEGCHSARAPRWIVELAVRTSDLLPALGFTHVVDSAASVVAGEAVASSCSTISYRRPVTAPNCFLVSSRGAKFWQFREIPIN